MSRIVAILMILAISGQVAAHGANSFYAIIVRNESVMPESADLIVNDTLVLYNTAAWERTAGIDLDGDGSFEHSCTMSARNTTSNEDECQFPSGRTSHGWQATTWSKFIRTVHFGRKYRSNSFPTTIASQRLRDRMSSSLTSTPWLRTWP